MCIVIVPVSHCKDTHYFDKTNNLPTYASGASSIFSFVAIFSNKYPFLLTINVLY